MALTETRTRICPFLFFFSSLHVFLTHAWLVQVAWVSALFGLRLTLSRMAPHSPLSLPSLPWDDLPPEGWSTAYRTFCTPSFFGVVFFNF